jgi:hypothetical protein
MLMMRIVALTLAAALIATVAVACNDGGGDSMTLDEYFAELDRLQNAGDERIAGVEFPMIDEQAPIEESREAYLTYFDNVVEAAEDVTDDINGLDPPDEAKALHDEYVEALRGIPEFANGYKERVSDAGSQQELAAVLLGDTEDDAINESIDEACTALQELADDNEIEVDLECV